MILYPKQAIITRSAAEKGHIKKGLETSIRDVKFIKHVLLFYPYVRAL